MADMYVAVNHDKKQLFNVGTVLSFDEFYVNEFLIASGKKPHYPKTYGEILAYVNDMLFSRSRANNERIAAALCAMGIDLVVSYHGARMYDIFDARYRDYRYIGSVYTHDDDIGKSVREIVKENED